MKVRTRQLMLLPTPTRWLLHGTRYLLFITGIVALSYVGFALLDARLYQVWAKRSLANQIRVEQKPSVTQIKLAVKAGDLLGRIDIPRLGVSVAVLQGTNSRMLRLGAGHIEGTPLPGEPGNSGIAGHRDTFFRGLKDVRRNDEIEFQTATGLFRYQVDWAKVVAPDDTSVLANSSESALTLVTCYPFYFVGPAPNRFAVRATQVLPSGTPR
jgi:LPXTG-site transpeptidase (sortase) family protein